MSIKSSVSWFICLQLRAVHRQISPSSIYSTAFLLSCKKISLIFLNLWNRVGSVSILHMRNINLVWQFWKNIAVAKLLIENISCMFSLSHRLFYSYWCKFFIILQNTINPPPLGFFFKKKKKSLYILSFNYGS